MIIVTEETNCNKFSGRPDAEIIAVGFTEYSEYLGHNVEGPCRIMRNYYNVVRFAVGSTCALVTKSERYFDDYDNVRYAVILNEDGSYEEVRTAREYQYGMPADFVDAPQVIIDCYNQIQANEAAFKKKERDARYEVYRAEQAEKAAKTPAKGKKVKVVRGRKVPIGTVGQCFWVGQSTYGERLGLKTDSGDTVWVALSNCEAI